MKFSEETNNLIDDVNSGSVNPVKNLYELSVIAEIALAGNKLNEFKDLIFTAKYIKGLKSVLNNRIVNADDFTEKIFDEFNSSLRKFIGQLKNYLNDSDEMIFKHFTDRYFRMDHDCILSTLELIDDLSLCKEYLNRNPDRL
ncbi:MAG: hypothetical protein JST15_06960 [Bacteroidetes bacterium]|nr:hypothetical protein [Bacteroidota bacterium]